MEKSPTFTCLAKQTLGNTFLQTLKTRRQLKVDMPVRRRIRNKTLFCTSPQIFFGFLSLWLPNNNLLAKDLYRLRGIFMRKLILNLSSPVLVQTKPTQAFLIAWLKGWWKEHSPSPTLSHHIFGFLSFILGLSNCFLCFLFSIYGWIVRMRLFIIFYTFFSFLSKSIVLSYFGKMMIPNQYSLLWSSI